ncbi:thiamine-phosphate kinase [Paenalcaligenes hominis]|uniref:thiamine-phosphate kinase n=1 Tax=Paenalcaligenes hominis TaxID=643674 RepID=UPI0035262636
MAALSEFSLIKTYFNQAAPEGYLGIGDDCAVFGVQPGYQLAVSTDILIEGRHFFSDVDPYQLGHKALAVNLSDLAAMGAKPIGCVLALALPSVQDNWLKAFSSGFYALAQQAQCPLLGGDTTRSQSEITLTVTVFGEVPITQALRRDVARVGDDIWLTGTLGAPDLALRYLNGTLALDAQRLAASRPLLEQPTPPIHFAPQLLGYAHAGIDISDGLLQDLGHVLTASHCGAQLDWGSLPMHEALQGLNPHLQQQCVLAGGDVFQLCFTAPAPYRAYFLELAAQCNIQLSRIGQVTTQQTGLVVYHQGQKLNLPQQAGFDHFLS